MTDMMSGVENVEKSKPATGLDEQLVAQLLSGARASGLKLTGEGGMLQQLTKLVLESALEGEITALPATAPTTRTPVPAAWPSPSAPCSPPCTASPRCPVA